MSSIVLALQQASLDSKTPVSELLRMALVVATKLKLPEFEKWTRSELGGYSNADEVPAYRRLSGELVVFDQLRGGWHRVLTHRLEPDVVKRINTFHLHYPVAELEADLRGENASAQFIIYYGPEAERYLTEKLNMQELKPGVRYQPAQFEAILHAVRDIVLEWALKLEQNGIVGEGLSFSAEERKAAAEAGPVTTYIRQVSNSQIQVGSCESAIEVHFKPLDLDVVRRLIRELKAGIGEAGFDGPCQELEADLGTIEAQVNSPKPKESIIREGLRSIRNILEGAAGSALASATLPQLIALLR